MFHLGYNLYTHCKTRGEKEVYFALLGLPNGGKTTIKQVVGGREEPMTVPTIGVTKPIHIERGKMKITVFDLGGSTTGLWRKYYPTIHAVIWVCDAADASKLEESRRTLHEHLKEPRLAGKPILVFANKQDLPQALSEVDIATKLGLADVMTASHTVRKCIALPSQNGGKVDPALEEGMSWLVEQVSSDYANLKVRVDADTEQYEKEEAIERKAKEERIAKAKAERKKAKEAAARGEVVKKEKKETPTIMCTVTYEAQVGRFSISNGSLFQCSQAATRKSGAWGWKPVCDVCHQWLQDGKPSLSPGAASAPTEEEAPAPADEEEAPAPADEEAPAPSEEVPVQEQAVTVVEEQQEANAGGEGETQAEG
eukprot:g1553.t1